MVHSKPSSLAVSDRLATLWTIVEARRTFPVLIVVASASDTDDTTSIARGLAQVAHESGWRTGYLRLNPGAQPIPTINGYSELRVAERGSPREAFDAAITDWRRGFDVLVVDVTDVRSQFLAAHVARIADGVVVAVCAGRRVLAADHEFASLLKEISASMLGVVFCRPAVPASAIRRSPDVARLEPAAQR
jgi:hypothetical protein